MALLSDLQQTRTREEVLNALLMSLQGRGFPVTDWVEGGVTRTLLEAVAAAIADEVSVLVPQVVRAGLLAHAEGEDLDALAENVYGLTRRPAQFAEGRVTLTAEPGMGPYNITAGSFWVGTELGLRYVALENVTVPAGGSATLRVRAESPGSAYNVAAGAINTVLTPLPGLSVTNPSGWLDTAGADAETDEQLRERCRLQWPTIGYAHPAEAYEAWALEASPAITRVAVLTHPRGQGTVDVVVYGAGGIGAADVAAADAYIQARRDLVADVQVYAATPVTVAVSGTVYVTAGLLAQVQTDVQVALDAYAAEVPIGGAIYNDAIIAAIRSVAGVIDVDLTAPTDDQLLGEVEVPQLDTSGLVYVEV